MRELFDSPWFWAICAMINLSGLILNVSEGSNLAYMNFFGITTSVFLIGTSSYRKGMESD